MASGLSAPMTRSARNLLLASALAVAAGGAAIAFGAPAGIPGEWVWRPNEVPVSLLPAVVPGLALVLVAAALARPGRWGALRPAGRAAWLGALIACLFAFQCALLTAVGHPLAGPGAVIASPSATTYFSVSFDIQNPRAWIGGYAARMPDLPYHARTHPPGLLLMFYAVRRAAAALIPRPGPFLQAAARDYNDTFGLGLSASDSAAAIASAFLIALIGALALAPIYLLARRLAGVDADSCAVALAAGIPAVAVLGASPDLIVLTVAASTLALAYHGYRAGSAPAAFLAGVMLALGLFLTFGLLGLVAWLTLWALIGLRGSQHRGVALRRIAAGGVAGAAGFFLFYVVLTLATGYQPIAVAREALFAHRGVTTVEASRTYWKWLLGNPLEAAFFAGAPLVLAALWGVRTLRNSPEHGRLRAFLVAWLATVALLDLSGTVRGEVGRIWAFLFWPAALAAAPWASSQPRRGVIVAALVFLEVWQAILMRGYLTMYSIL